MDAPRDSLGPLDGGLAPATVDLPSDREIRIVRAFAAPRAAVFDAWTRAEQIALWWDPSRQPLAACEVDLRPGGTFRFVPRGPAGESRAFVGRYCEIDPPSRLVFTTPGASPGSETVGTLVFVERAGGSLLTITMLCVTADDRDSLLRARVDAGTLLTLDNLDAHLTPLQSPPGVAARLSSESSMTLNIYVNFAGRCAEACRYYTTHLAATVDSMLTHADSPGASRLPPEWKQAVLHARVRIGGTELMAADIPNAQPMRSAYLTLSVESDAEAERVYAALSDGGRVLMKMEETFFATRFGQVQDQFGINWMILHQRPQSGTSMPGKTDPAPDGRS